MSVTEMDYEQLALGVLINNASALDDMALQESDFAFSANRLLFLTITEMSDAGHPVDMMLLAENLESKGLLVKMGGMPFLNGIVSTAPALANANSYAKIVRKQADARKMVQGGALIQSVLSSPGDMAERVGEAESILESLIGEKINTISQMHIGKALGLAIESLEDRYSKQGQEPEFAFGFKDLDEMTCGASAGDLIVVAGRPSMGKTAFAMNITENLCLKCKKTGLVISIEMGAAQLATRMLASIGRIDAQKMRKAELDDDDWGKITYATSKLHELKLHIDEASSISPAKIRRSAKQVIKESGDIGFIVIDYLQLMSGDKSKYENRTAEIGDISRSLKLLAKDLGVPIILLSQLNRSLEQRPNKRPIMSDLRESGAIEQDADIILFIYRDEVYNLDSIDKDKAEIIIAKQRNGPIGSVKLAFRSEITRFEDLT